MNDKRNLPAFASEAEEAQWWFDHREERDVEFAEAIRTGRAQTNMVRNRMAAREQASVPTTITIQDADAMTAARLAERNGMELSTYLHDLMHRAIQRENEQAA
ncbi:hypothetical protein [Granulicella tundricola]|uniref:Antitoxin n=1 Tax=Granulicella tundricola (strain ATCC BAA-1859 / DSM 23138 / MP5ACTX9) TaxID=1198114 RepID=E8X2U4_GRATM|nr:hypothetical protein [Granulicella tundricola]ADW70391.1 hypothetical protein AciX9_3384 [Granulicella tundricola MP5ACTX9]